MQNVFIINFNSLYEILDEIKENLSFKLIKIENEEDFKKKFDLNEDLSSFFKFAESCRTWKDRQTTLLKPLGCVV